MKIRVLTSLLAVFSFLSAQAPVDLAQLAYDAAFAGKREVTWPKGVYRLSTGNGNTHLSLSNLNGLKIQATGVTLLCTEIKTAFALRNCTNVELIGLTVDFDPLPYSQATVVSMDGDDNGFDLKVHAGYPSIAMEEGELYLFDGKTRQWKTGAWSGPRKVRYQAKGDLLHASLEQAGARHSVQKGDFVVQKFKGKSGHVAIIASCARTTLREVTLHTGPTFAVLETDGEANAYLGVRITPGPRPAGATEARLMANLADGIHSISSRIGPRIEGCLIEGHSDDGVAIHGRYSLILKPGNSPVIAAHTETAPFAPGERLRLTAGSNGAILSEVILKKIEPLDNSERPEAESIKNGMKLGNKNLYQSLRSYWTLAFDRDVSIVAGDVVDSPTRSGSGFTVRSNTIRNHRARGILIKASDGVIEDNLIEHSSIAGIVLAPEISWWLESGYSWNVLIARNRIVDCGYEHENGGHPQAGMISVVAAGMTRGLWAPAGGQRNIRILSNTVERCRSVNLLISSARDVLVQGNRFVRPLEEHWHSGSAFGVSSNTVVWVEDSEQVHFRDNRVANPGPFMERVVGLGSRTSGVTGVDGKSDASKGAPPSNVPVASASASPDFPPVKAQASTDFSGTQGLKGWKYLSREGADEVEMEWNPGKKQWEGKDSYCHVYANAQHPGGRFDSVRRYTAPNDGTLLITGSAKAPTTSDGVSLFILQNGEALWKAAVSPDKKGIPFPHELRTGVKSGDRIDFVVGRGGNNSSDYTAWDPMIEYVP